MDNKEKIFIPLTEVNIEHDSPSFIAAWFINPELCDKLKEDYDNKFDLTSFDEKRGYHRLNNEKMDATLMNEYKSQLEIVLDEYKKKFPWCADPNTVSWSLMTPFNVQKYDVGFYYKMHHIEDTGPRKDKLIRHLTFSTYLNDVEDAGETEFIYQQVKTSPVKGLTLIFPAGWTHPHCGHPAPTEEKYIITGWASFHHRC